MTDIETIRERGSTWLIILLGLHIPLIAVVGLLVGVPVVAPTVATVLVVGAVAGIWWQDRTGPASRYTFAVAAVFMPAMLVYLLRGHPWQIDFHMYFFCMLAVLMVLCDWRTILVSGVTIAFHHLILNFTLPAAVFPDGMSFGRVLLHASAVVVECLALIWVADRLVQTLSRAGAARDEAIAAKQQVAEEAAAREKAQQDSQQAQRAVRQQMADDMEQAVASIVGKVSDQVAHLDREAEAMQSVSKDVLGEVGTVDDAAQNTSASVETVSAATGELRTSIQDIAAQSSQAVDAVGAAADGAKNANQEVRTLEDAVANIGQVVNLIQDIAEQTNMLALNATIEAARAGEAGKGFAVVANEVKNLAGQTQKATEDISQRIDDIQSRTNTAVNAIHDVTSRMENIRDGMSSVASAIEEQEAAAREIAQSSQSATEGVQDVSQRMTHMNNVAESADQTATRVVRVASDLTSYTGDLDTQIKNFLADIRAG